MAPLLRNLAVSLLLLFLLFPVSAAELPFKFDSTPGKLPKDIVPRHYSLYLRPDLEKLITSGKVEIQIEVLKPAKQIMLNALDLEITSASITLDKRKISLQPKANAE